MTPEIISHCAEIERCNQRGRRMLSIVDLIEAGTVTRDIAAYSFAAINKGASFMIGALPGGAGKTTVMGALLNMVPRDTTLAAADSMNVIQHGLTETGQRHCYICHEIGAGNYYAYLWGEPLRRWFALPDAGHMLASNLHADTYNEAREQICVTNGVAESNFRRVNLIYFLRVNYGPRQTTRRVTSIYESDGVSAHRQVSAQGKTDNPAANSRIVSQAGFEEAKEKINVLLSSGARTIQEVRTQLVA